METKKAKKTTLQESVAYRLGTFTSKVSIQPAMFEAVLADKNYDDAAARQVFRELAVEARELQAKDISLYAQSKGLLSVVPQEIRDQITYNEESKGRTPIRFVNPVTNKPTKLTTLTVLVDLLNILHGDKAKDIHVSFAADYCRKRASANADEIKKCDLSHQVRERIISNLSAMFV
jgi:hypothetical protein